MTIVSHAMPFVGDKTQNDFSNVLKFGPPHSKKLNLVLFFKRVF